MAADPDQNGSSPTFQAENWEILQIGAREKILDKGALGLAAKFLKEHPDQPVGRFLLRKGFCGPRDFLELVSKLKSKLLYCPTCKSRTLSAPPLDDPRCTACTGPLVLPEHLPDPAEGPPTLDDALRDPLGAGRYELGKEIGRGGLGRVVEARDRLLGREVAVKEMVARTDNPEFVSRFIREGEVAGRLLHPNIVPVFDVGTQTGPGGNRYYFTMGRVHGRDLSEIIAHAGRVTQEREKSASPDAAPKPLYSRPRLLRFFQDACLAVAYAHAHGVIHRDLKPANVMVGEFGEVFVVDWGLAMLKDQSEEPRPRDTAKRSLPLDLPIDSTSLTLAGDVLGTPIYMPPEQAAGRTDEVDERSDIYSLGAILYEILTARPPFEGSTKKEVIGKVVEGELSPPSACCSDVPPELDEIVLKAMARKKSDRFRTVLELHEEIQEFLEGEKERERNHRIAVEKIAEGRDRVRSLRSLETELATLAEKAEVMRTQVKPFWPVEKKSELWEVEGKINQLRQDMGRRFAEANAAFQKALGFERDNPEARAALADLFWSSFLKYEEEEDENQRIYFEGLVREFNDGQYGERLKGNGALAVSTRAYPCRCLLDGREVSPEELGGAGGGIMGYHPLSGRDLEGRKYAEGLPELEPREPILLKVHGPDCRPGPLEGTRVWLFRFEEEGRLLVPVRPDLPAPHPGKPGNPPAEGLDRLYDPGSPFRPTEGLYLGETPIPPFEIPRGSYLLILAKEGFQPARVPVHIPRLGQEDLLVTMYTPEEIPEGFNQIAGGKFQYQGDKLNPFSGKRRSMRPKISSWRNSRSGAPSIWIF
ncbi:MAG: serine/threonine-protein kinase [Planctomycetota bacterium]|jgi:serine/threonine protein kinase